VIRRKRKESRLDELPIATLHLDDVRDILQILSAPDSDSDTSNPEVQTKFILRDQECDSIEDLEKVGGIARQLEMIVDNDGRESRLEISRVFSYLRLSCHETDFWVKRGKVRQIFETNKVWWKNTIAELLSRPVWWPLSAFAVISIIAQLLFPTLRVQRATDWIVTPGVALVLGVLYFSFGGAVVALRYSHTGGIRRWIRDHATQVMLVILGVLLKELGDWIFHHFQH
jgi:hypothetical protein